MQNFQIFSNKMSNSGTESGYESESYDFEVREDGDYRIVRIIMHHYDNDLSEERNCPIFNHPCTISLLRYYVEFDNGYRSWVSENYLYQYISNYSIFRRYWEAHFGCHFAKRLCREHSDETFDN